MFSRFLGIAALASAFVLTGCATPTTMPFADKAALKTDKTVYLMTATIKNVHRTSHQPKALVLHVERNDGTEKADRINYTMDAQAKDESDDEHKGSTYYLRMERVDGKFVVRGITAMSSSFPIHGFFFVPIHAQMQEVGPGVYYLGHVEAVARKRTEEEFKAGPMVPLIDQAVSGAATSTFDVVISDGWAADESAFKTRFPVLQTADIKKLILPAFDREVAQKWWAAH